MILLPLGTHLTYCTNIHPGETWNEVRVNLQRYLPEVKALVSPSETFGIGLRLSAEAAKSLSTPAELNALRDFLESHNLYVFTINGFPYGSFHGTRVKEKVYRPDWLEENRLAYTDRLAHVLAHLLPANSEVEGSISTVPGAFKPRVRSQQDIARLVDLIVRHVAALHHIFTTTGRVITLALEPEPCCFLETIEETTTFFTDHLFDLPAVDRLAQLTGLDRTRSEETLRRHVGVCLDTCHAAVEFEDPVQAVEILRSSGIRICKAQLSAGLKVPKLNQQTLDALQHFTDKVYLHQVVQRVEDKLQRYTDLIEALNAAAQSSLKSDCEWRIHFHVPIFMKDLGLFQTTQDFLVRILELQKKQPFTDHLEVETYTWDVLPDHYRETDVVGAIARELNWVRQGMGQ